MTPTSDILIIGGGAIGGALAWSLARRGAGVTVVEAGRVGRGASWAAAGVLAPEWNPHESPALASLAEASLALWPEWVAELEDRTGVGLNFRRDGLLNLWVDPDAPHLPPELATAPPPLGKGEMLSAAEVRDLEPLLTGPIAGGVLSRDDAQVDNPPGPARTLGNSGKINDLRSGAFVCITVLRGSLPNRVRRTDHGGPSACLFGRNRCAL